MNKMFVVKKLSFLKKDYFHKTKYFGKFCSLIYTLAPYTRIGNEAKHKAVLDYLNPLLFETYTAIEDKERRQDAIKEDMPIWVLWWQGVSLAPKVVKACIQSIQLNAGNHPVHLLSKDNLKDYVEIPSFIFEKVDSGEITLTHLSDIIRMALLAKYGGFWIDSTIYVTKQIGGYATPFYSIKQHSMSSRYVDNGNDWTAYFIATCEHSLVAETIYKFFLCYWQKHEELIDYYLVDYAITLCKKHIPGMAQWIDNIPYDSDRVNDMRLNLSSPFTDQLWNKLSVNRYNKLSWRSATFASGTIGEYITKSI